MKLPEFSVKRKVTTSMIAMILVVFGLISISRLGLDLFPDLEYPTVSIITTYRGASPEDIETTITQNIEQWVSSVKGVKKITSTSSEGASIVSVEFEWGTNLDFAAQDIRDQIGLYKKYLPENASDPLVVKFNLSQLPVIYYGVTAGGSMSTYRLKQLIEDEVKPRLERLDGVASAQVFSSDQREIRVEVDKNALIAYNLPLNQVLMALAAENVNTPAGDLIEGHEDLTVRTIGEFKSVDDINKVVVGVSPKGQPIYIKDIAQVKDTLKETRTLGRVQGENGVFLIINKRSGANTATVGKAVKQEMAKINSILPKEVKFTAVMDQQDMISRVTSRTASTAWQGGLLAMLIIFLFLRNWRPTFIISLAIPLSIVTTFIGLYFAGYTFNIMTLAGLALGVGMLVDNAIVVIENTFRHIELGEPVDGASIIGASEVGMAITASTLTTVIVFLPILFASGIVAKMTTAMALTVTLALLSSLFVALTIVPLFSSLLYKARGSEMADERAMKEPQFEGGRRFYRRLLVSALKKRKTVLAVAFGAFLISLAVIPFLHMEFMPESDQQQIILKITLPVGTSLEETNRVLSQAENLFLKQPEVLAVSAMAGSSAERNAMSAGGPMSLSGPNEAMLMARLVPKEKRKYSDKEILERVRKMLPRLENVKFEQINMQSAMLSGAAAPVEIKIFGKDLNVLKQLADEVVKKVSDVKGLRDVTHGLVQGSPEYQFTLDRERAARLGLSIGQISDLVLTSTQGKVVNRYREGKDEFDIRVVLAKEYRDNLDEIKTLPLMNQAGRTIYLAEVSDWKRGEGPVKITRENQVREVSVTANIIGRDLGSVVKDIRARLADFQKQLPEGYFIEYGGDYDQMVSTFKVLIFAMVLAILLIYMVMAAQFEHFLHPFVVMFTLPLALIGVVLGLVVAGQSISLISLVGVIILAGVAVNNGIVMIDYINQLIRKGMDRRKAVVEGAVTRLRPVLLTALTTIIGTIPMAVSKSSGSEMRSPIGVVMVGGLTVCTLLTLFIIPIIYSLINKISFKEYQAEKTEQETT
jgi:HAE1 family hydrophobic/amphiphilic exporter-1